MKKICFVILHYGDINVTRKCINSIKQLSTNDIVDIVIVDNDCDKKQEVRDKLNTLYKEEPQIYILRMDVNKGFSYANNMGYRFAVKKLKANYVIITNNDIIFNQKNFISIMKECYEKEKYAVLGPDIIGLVDKEHQNPMDEQGRTKKQLIYTIVMNTICMKLLDVVFPLLRLYNKILSRRKKKEQAKNIGYYKERQYDIVPCGACLIFSEIFINQEEKVFFPETEFYYEEYILHYNCLEKGYKIVYEPQLCVLHAHSVATKNKSQTEKDRWRFVIENTLKSALIYKDFIDRT